VRIYGCGRTRPHPYPRGSRSESALWVVNSTGRWPPNGWPNPVRDRQGVADLSRPSAWGSLRPVTNVSGLTTYSAWSPERADGPFRSGAGWWDRRSTGFRRSSARVRVGGCLTYADTDEVLPPHRWASGRRQGLMLAHPHFFLLASPLISPQRSGRAG